MILHASIPAANPAQVSAVLAEIIGGESCVFPPYERSFVALAKAEAGLSLEVYPDDLQLMPDTSGGDVVGVSWAAMLANGAPNRQESGVTP